jgi:archaellum biogenesis protein FlaJ (TadC family)
MPEWIPVSETTLWWLGVVSLLTFVGTLVVLPFLVARIPADYFVRDRQYRSASREQHIALHVLGLVVKNVVGVVFVLAGVAMLVLPGQGILTILIGLSLMNFPGKHALERRFVQQPTVLQAINWMRYKAGQPPLAVPSADAAVEKAQE